MFSLSPLRSKIRKVFEKLTHSPEQEADMSRLLKMREHKEQECECEQCVDFLSRIHINGGLVLHEHEAEHKASRFWTTVYPDDYKPPVGFHCEPTIGEIALHNVSRTAFVDHQEAERSDESANGSDNEAR